jgi:3'-5' exoribonuclease
LKKQYVKDLAPGHCVNDLFAVVDWSLKQGARGPYIACVLQDKTGQVDGKIWQPSKYFQQITKVDKVLLVSGQVDAFNGKPQIIIDAVSGWDDGLDLDESDFEPVAPIPFETLSGMLDDFIALVDNEHLKHLLHAVFDDPEIRGRFDIWPAARSFHHAVRHGLLQHTIEVTDLAMMIANSNSTWYYQTHADTDLAIAGALLHDIGKIREYQSEGLGRFTTSSEGLLGHIATGMAIVNQKIQEVEGFPTRLAEEVLHIIASHHGVPEWGALLPPATPEAVIVHLADLASARLYMQQQARADAAQGDVWSARRVGDGYVYVGPRGTVGNSLVPVDDEPILPEANTAASYTPGAFAGALLGGPTASGKLF